MALDRTYSVSNGMLFRHTEPDGAAYLRHKDNFEETECLCSVEEAKEKYPDLLRRAGYIKD